MEGAQKAIYIIQRDIQYGRVIIEIIFRSEILNASNMELHAYVKKKIFVISERRQNESNMSNEKLTKKEVQERRMGGNKE